MSALAFVTWPVHKILAKLNLVCMFAEDEPVHCFLTLVHWAVKILARIPVKRYTAKTIEPNCQAPAGI